MTRKFEQPNYTQTPNIFIDLDMRVYGPAKTVCMLVIVRKTFGFHRRRASISYNEFAALTGLTRRAVIDILKALEKDKHIKIIRPKNGDCNSYELGIKEDKNDCSQVVNENHLVKKNCSQVVNENHRGGERNALGVVNELHPLNKERKKDLNTTTKAPPKKPEKKEDSSSFLEYQKKKDLLASLPINDQTKDNAFNRFNLKTLEDALHNTKLSSYDDFGAYFFTQAKGIKEGSIRRKASPEEVAEKNKKLAQKLFPQPISKDYGFKYQEVYPPLVIKDPTEKNEFKVFVGTQDLTITQSKGGVFSQAFKFKDPACLYASVDYLKKFGVDVKKKLLTL